MSLRTPPREVIDAVHAQCPGCWPFFVGTIRNLRPVQGAVTASSWWRSSETNREVGGSATSQHLVGTAIDLVGPGARDVADQLRNAGWVWIPEGDHEHMQVFVQNPFNLRRVV